MKIRDSSEVQPPTGDLDTLVARIHDDLRKERKARAKRERAPDRRKALLALLLIATCLMAMVYFRQTGAF